MHSKSLKDNLLAALSHVSLLSFYLIGNPAMAQERPFILIGESRESMREKIDTQAWARSTYHRIVESVQPYVDRHTSDPEWMVSRLQMHWQTHYARTFVNGQVWSHGAGHAPVATPRFAGGRDWATPYERPALEDIHPFEEDPRGLWLQNRKKPGSPWEWAPVSETGQVIERINEHIMSLAEQSAFLYWYTGETAYAKLSADVFCTYVDGMFFRANPETVEDHSKARILGLATFEVIHEAITRSLAVTYDFLRDYLIQNGKDTARIETVFKRWADRIIEGGNAHGNWNINQARFIVYLGLSLQSNAVYPDGKGREFYIAQFTEISSANQTSLKDLVPVEYDQKQGIWPEAPGYAFSVTDNIVQLSHVIRNATGQDVIASYPLLEKAALVAFQYLFPNGLTVGFGDTCHQAPNAMTLELLIARARKNGDAAMEKRLAAALGRQMILCGYSRDKAGSLFALTSFVDALDLVEGEVDALSTRAFYAPAVSLFILRNGEDPTTGLMASLVGTKGGHMHANGLALELYGRGMVISPDPGRGSSYWQKEHGKYYKRFPAHNTVIVDGQSDYGGDDFPFELRHAEPVSESHQALSKQISFADVYFDEPKTGSDQRRLVSVIRTSAQSGYTVDIFRSRRRDGKDIRHEYLYHNLGQTIALENAAGHALPTTPTDELHSKHGDLVGYDYFRDKKQVGCDTDVTATFEMDPEDGVDVATRIWLAGSVGRTLFTAQSPVARSLAHGSAPEALREDPVPVLIVRQPGEAWTRPFVAVIACYSQTGGPSISHVESLQDEGSFAGVRVVSSRPGHRVDHIFSDTDAETPHTIAGMQFQGIYGVVSSDDAGLQSLYLGNGSRISSHGFTLEAREKRVSACLRREGGHYWLSSSGPILLLTPNGSLEREAGYGQRIVP
ncbi:MAG: heparinase II/III family protein [bacterium]|nr:heparinase II/III family protein [bacterium]